MAKSKISAADLDEAYHYFRASVEIFVLSEAQSFVPLTSLYNAYYDRFFSSSGPYGKSASSIPEFFREIILEFERIGACEIIRDSFADAYVKFSRRRLSEAQRPEKTGKIIELYKQIGPNGSSWLSSALVKITRSTSIEEVELFFSRQSHESQGVEFREGDHVENPEEEWTPIKFDRSSNDFTGVLDASEKALVEVEGSNGYAATEPEERNGITLAIRGSIESLKHGSPSLSYLTKSLLEPMKLWLKNLQRQQWESLPK